MRLAIVLLLASLGALPAAGAGIDSTGALRGRVTDIETGGGVASAVVSLGRAGSPLRMAITDEQGEFRLDSLEAGIWQLAVNQPGYRGLRLDVPIHARDVHVADLHLEPLLFHAAPVVVTGTHTHSQAGEQGAVILQGRELERHLGHTLASTLRDEAGVAVRSMGPAPARPVIRGLGGERVRFSEDGIKTTDLSASSPDHALTIDPFTVESIEVQRGPQVLTSSSSAFGGTVNVVRHDIPFDRHTDAQVSLGASGESANHGRVGAGTAELPIGDMAVHADVSARGSDDLRTPAGMLANTASRSFSGAVGAAWLPSDAVLGASARSYTLEYGLPGGFVGAHPDGVDVELERVLYSARANGTMSGDGPLRGWDVSAARAYYRHKELENGLVGAEFRVVDWTARASLRHDLAEGMRDGVAGVDAEYRDYSVGGAVFTSPATSRGAEVYLLENWDGGALHLQAALRAGWKRVEPEVETQSSIGYIRTRDFGLAAFSATATFHLLPTLFVGVNAARTARAPSIEELYTEGPHLAAYSYDVGNPDLGLEQGWGGEVFLHWNTEGTDVAVTFFRNDFSTFILPRNTGDTNYATFLPIYATTGVPALLWGGEATLNAALPWNLRARGTFGFTHGSFRPGGAPLPQIPPMKILLGVDYERGIFTCGASMEAAAAQERVDDFEQPTDGYVLFGMHAQFNLAWLGALHNASLSLDNIFDTEYRNHLSRVKSIMPEAGRSLRCTWKSYFSL